MASAKSLTIDFIYGNFYKKLDHPFLRTPLNSSYQKKFLEKFSRIICARVFFVKLKTVGLQLY